MPSRSLPNLGLQAFFALGEDGWNDEMDLNMLKVSALAQGVAISKVSVEPGSPTQGAVHILDETHATRPNQIAIYDNGAWVYITPQEGWVIYDANAGFHLRFDGSVWGAFGHNLIIANSISGRYFPPDTLDFSTGTVSGSGNVLWLQPFSKKITIDQLVCRVTTAASGENIRLAMYDSDPNTGMPTSLIYDSGNISATATGLKTYTLPTPYIVTHPIWIGRAHSATITVRQGTKRNGNHVFGYTDIDTAADSGDNARLYSITFGALPSSLVGQGSPISVTGMVAVRAA